MAAAEGIYRVINTHMAEGIRLVSVRRGVDPRRFAILSFGGAAALHVTDVARQLDLERVIVPRLSAVLSAWGMLACEPALRGGAHAYRRRQPSRCRRRYARPSARWKPRAASGSRPRRSRARSACGRPPTCATASRCSRWACRSIGIDFDGAGSAAADGGRISRPPRGALHLQPQGPGSRAGQRAGGGDRRAAGPAAGARVAGPAAGDACAASAGSTSEDGARCRSTNSMRLHRTRRSRDRR